MHLQRNPNTFANNPLDRLAHRRLDNLWLDARWRAPSSLVIPFRQLKPLIVLAQEKGAPALPGWRRPEEVPDDALRVFLGVKDAVAHFAVAVAGTEQKQHTDALESPGKFIDLRSITPDLEAGDASILAEAKALIDWHEKHLFCALCGHRTEAADGGHKRMCRHCDREHFPRTDPVVIALVVRGDRCLLGRGTVFPDKMYSALAGFVEPGETIEEAVKREIWEEVGVRVSAVRYLFSQPWPFPSSLMIGCMAQAHSDALTLDPVEIADARWLARAEVKDLLNGTGDGALRVPPPMAIAHQLLKHWVQAGEGG